MAYCTQADLEAVIGAERLSELTDLEKTAPGYINAARVAAACDEASTMIDSHAAKHYAVPFNPPSAVIKAMAVKLAIYALIETSPVGPTPEQMAQQEARIKWLEALAAHKVTPGTTPSPAPHTMVVDKAYDRPATKAVSREKTKGYW